MLIFIYLFMSFIGYASEVEHLIGVPPDLDKYKIEGGVKQRSLQINGTTTPPTVIINGIKSKLMPIQAQNGDFGVYVDNKKLDVHGKVGRFYFELKPREQNKNLDIIIVGVNSYKVSLSHKKLDFEKSISETLYLPKSSKKIWPLKGVVPSDVEIELNKYSVKSEKGNIIIPLSLVGGSHNILIKIKSQESTRASYFPYKVDVLSGAVNKTFLSLRDHNVLNKKVWDIPYYGAYFSGLTNPGNKVKVGEQLYVADMRGRFNFKIKFNCKVDVPTNIKFQVISVFGNEQTSKAVKSSACERFVKKDSSRFYFGTGFGHFGVLDSPHEGVSLMYSKYPGLGPRISLGVRMHKEYYFEIRGFKTQSFQNSKKEYVKSFGGWSFWLGYPYRGRWFAGLGFLNYSVADLRKPSDPNFFGFGNKRATTMGFEGGYRWFVSPSWTWNTRLILAPKELSFQKLDSRIWPFAIIEPLAMEFHF